MKNRKAEKTQNVRKEAKETRKDGPKVKTGVKAGGWIIVKG